MKTEQIQILIVDDHPMVRDGLTMMLKSLAPRFDFIVSEAESGEIAIEHVAAKPFDIIIMDYNLPQMNGGEATQRILLQYPKYKVLALSNSDELLNTHHMIDCGAKGFILKNISPTELGKAIEAVLDGGIYYSHEVSLKLLAHGEENKGGRRSRNINKLTLAETRILMCLVDQKSDIEIANTLKISSRTVESHIHHMLMKLNMKNRTNLIMYAMNRELKREMP